MNFIAGNIYHIYNRGNNKQYIFFNNNNYVYFLQKLRKYISPCCNILAYALMPNHFHFLIHADDRTVVRKGELNVARNALSEGVRLLLSSYTKGINKQEGRTGNLIQQNTRSKCVYEADGSNDYLKRCFDYIHFNPVSSGMVEKPEDWDFSSYVDYIGLRKGTLCDQSLTTSLIGPQFEKFKRAPLFTEEMIDHIF